MICPKCKSTNIRSERSPTGEIKCNACGFVIKERGSKESLLPITEQDYPMQNVKEPKKVSDYMDQIKTKYRTFSFTGVTMDGDFVDATSSGFVPDSAVGAIKNAIQKADKKELRE